jgi:hypothetical protein
MSYLKLDSGHAVTNQNMIDMIVFLRSYVRLLGKLGLKQCRYRDEHHLLRYGGLGLRDAKIMVERHLSRLG